MLEALNKQYGTPLDKDSVSALKPHLPQPTQEAENKPLDPDARLVEPTCIWLAFKLQVLKRGYETPFSLEHGDVRSFGTVADSHLRPLANEASLHKQTRAKSLFHTYVHQLLDRHDPRLIYRALALIAISSVGLAEDELIDLLTTKWDQWSFEGRKSHKPKKSASVHQEGDRSAPEQLSASTTHPVSQAEEGSHPNQTTSRSSRESKGQGASKQDAESRKDGSAAGGFFYVNARERPSSAPETEVTNLTVLRLLRDLSPFLKERPTDACRVVDFIHVEFRTQALSISCPDEGSKVQAHAVLAAYFSGREGLRVFAVEDTQSEPYRNARKALSCLLANPSFGSQPWFWDQDLSTTTSQVDLSTSMIDDQPAGPTHERRQRVMNLRKMRELVPQLISAGLVASATAILTDLQYNKFKCDTGSMSSLTREHQAIKARKHSGVGGNQSRFLDACGEFARFISQHRSVIIRDPAMVFQFAANSRDGAPARAALRILDRHKGHPPWIQWLNPDTDNSIASEWILQAHEEQIVCLSCSRDGKALATCSLSKKVNVWDLNTGKRLLEVPVQINRVECLAIADDYAHLGLGDIDGQLKAWPLRTALGTNGQVKPLSSIPEFGVGGHAGPVKGIVFLPETGMLLSCGADAVIKVWSLASCSIVRTFKGHAASVNGIIMRNPRPRQNKSLQQKEGNYSYRSIDNSHSTAFTWSDDGTVKEWHIETGTCLQTYKAHADPVLSVDVSEVLDVIVSSSEDATCRTFRRSDGQRLGTIRHDVPVAFVALDSEAEVLASVCKDGKLRMWDIRSLVRVGSTDAVGNQSVIISERSDYIRCTVNSATGVLIVGVKDGVVKGFPLRANNFLAHSPAKQRQKSGVIALAMVGVTLVTAGENANIAVWDMRTGDCRSRWNTNQGRVTSIALENTEGWLLATGSSTGNILFWDIRVEGEDIEPAAGLAAHLHAITSVRFSADGLRFLSASQDGSIRTWNLYLPIQDTSKYFNSSNRSVSPHVRGARPRSGSMLSLSSPDHLTPEFTLKVLHTLNGHTEAVFSAEFNTDGLTVASASMDGTIRIWELATGAMQAVLRPLGKTPLFTSLAWSPDGRKLVSGSDDGWVRVWSVGKQREVLVLKTRRDLEIFQDLSVDTILNSKAWKLNQIDGHRAPITAVKFTESGEHLVTSSQDGTVKTWSAQDGRMIRTLIRCEHEISVLDILINDFGDKIMAACSDGFVRGARFPAIPPPLPDLPDTPLQLPPLKEKKEIKDISQKQSVREDVKEKKQKVKNRKDKDKRKPGALTPLPLSPEKNEDMQRYLEAEAEELGLPFKKDLPPTSELEVSIHGEDRIFGTGIAVKRIAHTALSTLMATVSEGQKEIELRDPQTLAVSRKLTGHVDVVTDIEAGTNGKWLMSASMDGIFKVWEVSTGNVRFSHPCFRHGITATALHQPLELAAAGSSFGDMQVVDLSSGSIVTDFTGTEFKTVSMGFVCDGRLLAYGQEDGTCGLKDLRDNKQSTVFDFKALRDKELAAKRGFFGGIAHALQPGELLKKDKGTPGMRDMACSPDGRLMARAVNKTVEVWDIRTLKRLHVDRAHNSDVMCVRFLDQGRQLISGGSDCIVRIWSIPEYEQELGVSLAGSAPDFREVRQSDLNMTGIFGQGEVVPQQGSSGLSFFAKQGVACLGGISSESFMAGDFGGRLYSLSLQPAIQPY